MATNSSSFKVDITGTRFRVDAVEPRTDLDGNPVLDKTTREQKFAVHLTVRHPERVRPDQWMVTVVGAPKIAVDGYVQLIGVVAYPWEQGDRHGIALRADSIVPENAPSSSSRQPA